MNGYRVERVQDLEAVFGPLQLLHRAHWDETEEYRKAAFCPQYETFKKYWVWKMVRIWVARHGEEIVGHLTVYLHTSMHTGEVLATEDALYVLPEHRKGVGTALVRQCIADLREEGVAEIWATTKPETRVGLILRRLGFSHVADKYLIRLKG